MKEKGKIEGVDLFLRQGRLKAEARILNSSGQVIKAYRPDRELAALLPRSILVGKNNDVPIEILDTIEPMLKKLSLGRQVRVWTYKDDNYASFLSWRSVRFQIRDSISLPAANQA